MNPPLAEIVVAVLLLCSALVVLGVSMLPLVTLFGERGELAWQLWVPALGQQVLMTRLLRGEAIFAVAKDPSRPFVVASGLIAVSVPHGRARET